MVKKRGQDEEWVEEYFKNPGYGPPDGTIVSLTEDEARDHVEMLCEKLYDDDVKRRYKAAEALAPYIADQKYLPEELPIHPATVLALAILKNSNDRMFCVSCARSLGMMGAHAAPYASAALAKAISISSTELRYEAILSLRRFGPKAAPEAAAALAWVVTEDAEARLRREAVKALAAMGEAAVAAGGVAVARACSDEDTDVQVVAIRALADLGPTNAEQAGPALKEALEKGSQEIRRFAVNTVIKLGPPVAQWTGAILSQFLKNEPGNDPKLRTKAAEALMVLGPDVCYENE
ncbi:unnamed protein product, partial [Polarella glacialis]